MIGNPVYNVGDRVSFDIRGKNCMRHTVIGTVEIIDRYGTFGQHAEVSYDVMVNDWLGTGEPMFCKHIVESRLRKAE